ncbi:E3 ubiquitin- ligase PRT1 [Olea europaea subsp. europaea]|uniref:E3 ubiquitin- ligase PRT1 n=1 Tax=Olea europaea subsp. europaea TaxID=158383 RepID=A0A8S0RB10_OLEEU|nr:E3 ubiquitin- ligase PRT1 [Olea europaea subsp. europaea]
MNNQGKEDYGDIGSEDFPDEFQCCVCLDIMYKPVVLACGHISCFWCVFKAMDSFRESHCPICRNPYNHFPSICRLLHFLLLKLYPSAYKRRERQVAEEKKYGHTSPRFDGFSDSLSDKALGVQDTSPHTAATVFNMTQRRDSSLIQDSSVNEANMTMIPTTSSQESTTNMAKQGDSMVKSEVKNEARKQILMTDLQCTLCKQLLYRPIVLNCGHVYCEACINNQVNKVCRCPACQSVHPNGFPNVCFVLEHFLEEHFPEEYSARKVSLADQLHTNPSERTARKREQATECSSFPRRAYLSWLSDRGTKFHPAVGCDWCGMYPIVGERYKCKDCVEEIGFDLCEECYKSSSKLPGRFNQQHTPEHQFVIEKPIFQLRFEAVPPEHHDTGSLGITEEVMVSNSSNDTSQDEVDGAASLNLSPDSLQDLGNSIALPVPFNNPSEDQEYTDSGT